MNYKIVLYAQFKKNQSCNFIQYFICMKSLNNEIVKQNQKYNIVDTTLLKLLTCDENVKIRISYVQDGSSLALFMVFESISVGLGL